MKNFYFDIGRLEKGKDGKPHFKVTRLGKVTARIEKAKMNRKASGKGA